MHLAYTIAFDSARSGGHRLLAKMLAMSLVRSRFDGTILIFRNTEAPIFQLPREGILEHYIPTGQLTEKMVQGEAWSWKYRVARLVAEQADLLQAERILFLDADILCLRNPDHLLDGDWDIAFCTESRSIRAPNWNGYLTDYEMAHLKRKAINSGTMAIRTERYESVMEEWARIHSGPARAGTVFHEQGAWNRLILDTGLRTRAFEKDAIMYPMNEESDYRIYSQATFIHCLGGDLREKIRFMFGIYLSTWFFDDQGTLLNLLDM